LASRARPCAARTRLFELIATPRGALRAPPASLLLIRQKSIQCGPPTSKAFFTPLNHMQTAPPAHRSSADPSRNILGQNYVPVRHYALIFSVFPFFIVWIFNFCYSLLFIPSFLISSYSSLLILLFLSLLFLLVGATCILRLLIFFSSYILNCLLYCRHNISVILRGFSRGAKPFLIHLRSKLMYTVRPYVLTFLFILF
jgi:hypothetical protein